MNTETPDTHPSPLSNAEAVQILTDGRLLASLTPRQKDAVLRAVHLVSRRSAQKMRNARRKADKGAFHTPDAILANPPFAQTPAPLSPDAPPCVPAPDTNPALVGGDAGAAKRAERLAENVMQEEERHA